MCEEGPLVANGQPMLLRLDFYVATILNMSLCIFKPGDIHCIGVLNRQKCDLQGGEDDIKPDSPFLEFALLHFSGIVLLCCPCLFSCLSKPFSYPSSFVLLVNES